MKKIVYTAIINNYDTLKEPLVKSPDWEYRCYTTEKIKSKNWTIYPVSSERDPRRKSRVTKITPNFDYDIAVWVDASFLIKKDMNEFMKLIPEDVKWAVLKHPDRNTTAQEAEAVIKYKKDYPHIVNIQMEKYKNEGFPDNLPMIASGVFVRRKDPIVDKVSKMWLNEVLSHSRRDQLSFNYTCWKNNFKPYIIDIPINSEYFTLFKHKKLK